MNANHDQLKESIKRETGIVERDMRCVDMAMNKVDAQLAYHRSMISTLQKQKEREALRKASSKTELRNKLTTMTQVQAESRKTERKIDEIRAEMQSNARSQLGAAFDEALGRCEKGFDEWSTQDVRKWMHLIEDGRFEEDGYTELYSAMRKLGVCGHSLADLANESCLKLIGLDAEDRALVVKNIERVLSRAGRGRSSSLCMVCIKSTVNSVFTPCGHQAVCFACYQRQQTRFSRCPICRKHVDQTIKTSMHGFK